MDIPGKEGRINHPWFWLVTSIIVLVGSLLPACEESTSLKETSESYPTVTASQATECDRYPVMAESGTCSAIALSNSIASMVERVEPAVVFISAEIETESFFFGTTIQEASGSGVIISEDGYILTNNHVVEDASRLKVTVPDMPHSFEAEVVGTDPLTDLAVIKIDGDGWPTLPFGNVSSLRAGNLVIAMGYPLALDQGATITLGVVSNIERSFTVDDSTFYDVIQTDAAINQGNSGGPLLDLTGGVVGINSVLFGGAQNIGFAISANTAKPVYEALMGPDHRVIRPWLGVVLADVTPDLADDADLSRQSGVVITQVVEDSPAYEAGLQVRDVVTQFQGEEMTTASQLIKALWNYRVGDEVNVVYWRDGERKEAQISLTVERPDQ